MSIFEDRGIPLVDGSFFEDSAVERRHKYLDVFFRLVEEQRPSPRCVVEVGTCIGRWARAMIERFPSIEVMFCLDVWPDRADKHHLTGTDNLREFMRHLRPWLWTRVFPVRADGVWWADVFGHQVDVVYLDASKEPGFLARAIRAWHPKLSSGGLMVGHDFMRSHFAVLDAEVGKGKYGLLEGVDTWGTTAWWTRRD